MHNVSVIDRAGAVLEGMWSGQLPMPALGSMVQVSMNNLGMGSLEDYVLREGYIGLRVQLHAPPDWYTRQNDGNPVATVYGAELTKLSTPVDGRMGRFVWREGDVKWLGKD
jgi:hypothetical protein